MLASFQTILRRRETWPCLVSPALSLGLMVPSGTVAGNLQPAVNISQPSCPPLWILGSPLSPSPITGLPSPAQSGAGPPAAVQDACPSLALCTMHSASRLASLPALEPIGPASPVLPQTQGSAPAGLPCPSCMSCLSQAPRLQLLTAAMPLLPHHRASCSAGWNFPRGGISTLPLKNSIKLEYLCRMLCPQEDLCSQRQLPLQG